MTWTEARRREQAARIQRTKPWLKSTGPRTSDGKAVSSRNAFKGGVRPVLRKCSRELVRQAAMLTNLSHHPTSPERCE